MLQATLRLILNNKLVTLLSIILVSFFISTIVLAVQKDNYAADLDTCRAELNNIDSPTTTEISTTTDPTTTTDSTNTTTTDPPDVSEPTELDYRLPGHVVPHHYDLLLNPDIDNNTFVGEVTITIEVTSSTDAIFLHSNGLSYETTELIDNDTGEEVNSEIEIELVDDDREFLIVHLDPVLPIGVYNLTFKFSGRLDNGIVGLYSSTISENNKMAASKFQPTYARQAFPCFDEPQFKATYDIHLVHHNDFIALSNMPESQSEDYGDAGMKQTTFERSVAMSTYLAVFVICNFESDNVDVDSNGIGESFAIKNFAQPGQLDKIGFALEISKLSTEFFIDYFQTEYPLPKLDQIAIPDYVSGATEHWGLITYRETSFLIDPITSSSLNKRNVATTIAHELAHMWFGNLVTMMWWDETWLNEGFATYMAYKCLETIHPEWEIISSFPVRVLHGVLNLDATLASHPIVMEVNTPDEITAIFDAISYNKGASVLRMLDHFIGEEEFQKGISEYLDKYKYLNTVTQDLLDVLADQFEPTNSNLNLTHIMGTWIKQMGYPVLTVSFVEDDPSADSTEVVIRQKRFLTDPNATVTEESEYNYRWFIPITYKTSNQSDHGIVWFPDNEDEVKILIDGPDLSWIMLNRDQVGYYRVNYAEQIWNSLIDLLHSEENFEEFSPAERAMLINDAYSLADAGETLFAVPLSLTTYLSHENKWAPWAAAISRLNVMQRRLQDTLLYSKFRTYAVDIVKPVYDNQDWNLISTDGSLVENLLRSDILSFACSLGYSPALNLTVTLFSDWLTNTSEPLDADLKSTVYFYGVQNSGNDEWQQLWDIYMDEQDAQEKARLLQALSATRIPALLNLLLNRAWDEENVRAQDQITVLQQVAANPVGTPIVWDHVRENWNRLIDKFTLNSRVLGGMIPSITGAFSTNIKLLEMQSFYDQYPDAGAGASGRAQSLENVANNIAWRSKYEATIEEWLNVNVI